MLKEIDKHWYRYFFGICLGVIVLLATISLYDNYVFTQRVKNTCDKSCLTCLSVSKDSLHKLISVFKAGTKNVTEFDEKINSINARINDFYVFSGIIITLLLAINVSVYIKTSNEVDKHMKDNYDAYKQEIEKQLQDAKQLVGLIQGEHDFAKKINSKTKEDLTPD